MSSTFLRWEKGAENGGEAKLDFLTPMLPFCCTIMNWHAPIVGVVLGGSRRGLDGADYSARSPCT